jgi:hypothetical protein
MGAGIAASPHCAEHGYAGVRNLVDRTRRLTNPLSILAHQLRRRFPSTSRSPEGFYPPTFHGPSWDDLYRVPLRSPHPDSPQGGPGDAGAASRDRKIISSGASSRLAPPPLPKEPQHCLPAEIGPLVTCRTHLAVADPQGRPGPPSRSPSHHAHVRRVAKAKNMGRSLWITGISGTTVGTLS